MSTDVAAFQVIVPHNIHEGEEFFRVQHRVDLGRLQPQVLPAVPPALRVPQLQAEWHEHLPAAQSDVWSFRTEGFLSWPFCSIYCEAWASALQGKVCPLQQ